MRITLTTALLILCNLQSFAAPPKLEIPTELKPTGDYVTHKPKTDAVSIIYVGLSGIDAFPSEFLKDSRDFILPTRGIPTGVYKFSAVAASATGEQVRQDFTVVIGKPVVIPPVDPPPIGPPPPTSNLYFLVVRPDGPADPNFTKVWSMKEWDSLAFMGHSFKDKPLTEASISLTALNISLPPGTTLPCVLTLRNKKLVAGPTPLPTTSDGILQLAKGVK